VALRLSQRAGLRDPIASQIAVPILSRTGSLTLWGIGFSAAILVAASALGFRLGLPTALAGAQTAVIVLLCRRQAPWDLLRNIPWSVLPLVAGLFVLVEGLAHTGVIQVLSGALQTEDSPAATSWAAGAIAAVVCNLMNNLPVGLVAGSAVAAAAPLAPQVTGALLIGVDLGPNLSVTGSLATILWLVALRREGLEIGAWRFLRIGTVVMVPALVLALAGLFVGHTR
jgi:arsenical pump membrane protein